MVSPFDIQDPDNAVPDGSWEPYVKYSQFWNLAYMASKPPLNQIPDLTIGPFNTGLAGGIGDAIFNSLLSPVNDAFSAITAYLNDVSFAGMFWTI